MLFKQVLTKTLEMRKTLVAACMLASVMVANAQTKLPSWLSQVKLSGYALTQYQYSGQENAKANSFNLRIVRAVLDGRIADDFYWKMQVQLNGNTTTNTLSPRLVDLFAEWQKCVQKTDQSFRMIAEYLLEREVCLRIQVLHNHLF